MRSTIEIILRKLDKVIVGLSGWEHIPLSGTNFMYIYPYIYKGKAITLKDGTFVEKGDWVAELHLDNKRLKDREISYSGLIRLLKGELKALQGCFDLEPFLRIKAVYGITVFHEIAARQGFTVLDIRNVPKRYIWSLWENILRVFFKKERKKGKKRFVVSKECWISREQIQSGMGL